MLTSCATDEAPGADTPAPDLAAATAALPNSDIFVAPLSFDGGTPAIGDAINITDDPGYDNQPSFLPDEHRFFFVSEGASGKTDIWGYDIGAGDKIKISETPLVSEYSPRSAPLDYGVSYIQENEAGDVTRVHSMPTAEAAGAAVTDFAPLGYYAWLDGGKALGVFYRSEPGSLYVVDIASGKTEMVAENIGRGLQSDTDGRGMWFTQADESGVHTLNYLDFASRDIRPVAQLPGETQDYAILFDKSGTGAIIFAADGSTLQYLHIGDNQWRAIEGAVSSDIQAITRIAVSDDRQWIAFVGNL